MRATPLLTLLGCVACASGASAPATTVVSQPMVYDATSVTYGVEVTRAREAVSGELQAPFDSVFAAIPAVMAQLNLAVERADARTGTVVSRETRFRGPLAGARLSTWFECGQSAMGKTADRYGILLRITSSVQPARGEHSMLTTLLAAKAKPDDQGMAVECDSNGKLEQAFANLVALHVARSQKP